MSKVKIEVIRSAHGTCIYVNEYLIAGMKPWGGGQVMLSMEAEESDVILALEKSTYGDKPEETEEAAESDEPPTGDLPS